MPKLWYTLKLNLHASWHVCYILHTRSVGIVRSRTKATELLLLLCVAEELFKKYNKMIINLNTERDI
jgi:hypothetical protein